MSNIKKILAVAASVVFLFIWTMVTLKVSFGVDLFNHPIQYVVTKEMTVSMSCPSMDCRALEVLSSGEIVISDGRVIENPLNLGCVQYLKTSKGYICAADVMKVKEDEK